MTWVDSVRPFAPGVKKFALSLFCLQAIAIALMVNTTVAFALVVILASCLIKIYKIDPEPVLLLLMHAAISCSMLYDVLTTFAIIAVVVAAVVTFGEYDLPTERVAVFVVSVTTTAVLGKMPAALISVIVGIGIVLLKLRPVEPASISLLTLGSLALTLLVNRVAGYVMVVIVMGAMTGLFVFNRVKKPFNATPSSTANGTVTRSRPVTAHPNGYIPMSKTTESLDLHGHTVTGAMKVLHSFLQEHEEEYRRNRAQHTRHVTIITGDGNHSNPHDGSNLIKPTVVNYLKINKYRYDFPDVPGLIKVDLESHVL